MAKEPSDKVKKAVVLMVENVRSPKPKSKGEILLEAGYSQSVAVAPTKVTRSQAFVALMEESGLTDDYLKKKLQEGMEATKLYGKDGIKHPDYAVQFKYFEFAAKLKGIQPDVVAPSTVNNTLNINGVDAKELSNNILDNILETTKKAPE